MTTSDTQRTLEAIWRIESPKLIAGLARLVRDIGIAEELAQDAFVSALVQWPEAGIPRNPGAWLMSIAKRRAIDRFRRDDVLERKHEEIVRNTPLHDVQPDIDEGDTIDDDLLCLMFIACHPILSVDARVALTLRLLGSLTTIEIARAFLISEATVAQRIVRAKRTLSEAHVPFEVPDLSERAARLSSVLEAIYLIYNEGYSAATGDDVMRPELCEDALRLGRVLAQLMPDEPEVHGLIALMELQSSRAKARIGPSGEPVLLLEQDRGKWDHLMIARGLAALVRAERGGLGAYGLQAAIAACHARSRTPQETDWPRIAALYDALAEMLPSPVIQLNRAVAIGMAYGPAAGLELVDALASEPALTSYHLLPAVRGDLLEKLSRFSEARDAFERAGSLAQNTRERTLFLQRAATCARS